MTDAAPAKPAGKAAKAAPAAAASAKIEDTITIAAVVKQEDAISAQTREEMEAGKAAVAANAERLAKMEAEEAAAVELIARDNTLVPGFSTPGQPFVPTP